MVVTGPTGLLVAAVASTIDVTAAAGGAPIGSTAAVVRAAAVVGCRTSAPALASSAGVEVNDTTSGATDDGTVADRCVGVVDRCVVAAGELGAALEPQAASTHAASHSHTAVRPAGP